MFDERLARAEDAWLRAPEPTELEEKLGEAFDEVSDYTAGYAQRITKQADNLSSIEDLKKLLAEVEGLAASLEDSITEIENLEDEYER